MRQIKGTVVAIVALIILYFTYTQARAMGAPNIFTIVPAFMAVLILLKVARTWLRGY